MTTEDEATFQRRIEEWKAPSREPRVRRRWVCVLLYLGSLGLYGLYWLYRMHRELPRRARRDTGALWALGSWMLPAAVAIALLIQSGIRGEGAFERASDGERLLLWAALAVLFVAHLLYLAMAHRLSERVEHALERSHSIDVLGISFLSLTYAVALVFVRYIALRLNEVGAVALPPWVESMNGGLALVSIVLAWNWWNGVHSGANLLASDPHLMEKLGGGPAAAAGGATRSR